MRSAGCAGRRDMPISQIARVLGISRNTVRAALTQEGPAEVSAAAGGGADAFEPRVPELLRVFPSMPSTVIAERIGWPYSIRTLSGRVAQLRVGVPAAGSGAADQLWCRRDRPVRSVVPAGSAADGVRVNPQARPAAGADEACGYSQWLSGVLTPPGARRTCSRTGGS